MQFFNRHPPEPPDIEGDSWERAGDNPQLELALEDTEGEETQPYLNIRYVDKYEHQFD